MRLVLGQEGRQLAAWRSISAGRLVVSDRLRSAPHRPAAVRGIAFGGAGIGDAGRQPRRGAVARCLVETDAGGVRRRIESGFQRRGENRLLVVGMVARPASPEDGLPTASPCAFLTRPQ